MIFRTGGCLIVGNCSEEILRFVYAFVKKLLFDEYEHIYMDGKMDKVGDKDAKQRKRKITVSSTYFSDIKRIAL